MTSPSPLPTYPLPPPKKKNKPPKPPKPPNPPLPPPNCQKLNRQNRSNNRDESCGVDDALVYLFRHTFIANIAPKLSKYLCSECTKLEPRIIRE